MTMTNVKRQHTVISKLDADVNAYEAAKHNNKAEHTATNAEEVGDRTCSYVNSEYKLQSKPYEKEPSAELNKDAQTHKATEKASAQRAKAYLDEKIEVQITRPKLTRRSPIRRRHHQRRLAEENSVQEYSLM